jgi:hypothetical protein
VTFDQFRPPQQTMIIPQNDAGGLMLSDMLVPDVATTEQPNNDALPTRLPVENGSDVSDNIVIQPTRLGLGVVHSNHPADLLGLDAGPMRARQFYEDLFRFQQTKQLLSIVTPHRVYENMVLVSLPPAWDNTNGEGFVATLQFEEIVRVETRIVALQRSNSGGNLKDGGHKTMKTATPAEAESFLHTLRVGG